jgi:Ca2+-binding EF-hand superfamily protein
MNGISSISGYASYAYAQGISGTQRHGGGDPFNKVDSDGSGGVSQSELDAFVVNISSASGTTISTDDAISTYDTDGDSELSSTELKSFMDANRPEQPPMGMMGMPGMQGGGPKNPEEVFSEADTDGSGTLSQTELEALAEQISQDTGTTIDTTDAISTYDTDSDGELSSTELKSFMDANRPEQPPMGMMGMPGSQDTSSSDDLFSSITDDAISTYDTDGDGKLSSTELKSFFENSASKLASDFILKALSAYTMGGYGSDTTSSMSLEA